MAIAALRPFIGSLPASVSKCDEGGTVKGRGRYLAVVHSVHLSCLAFASFFALVPVLASQAQMDPTPTEENRMRELVDDLKDLIQKADGDDRSEPGLLRQLRDLVGRYDWPWRVLLLREDFRDGDYTYDPPWIVNHGEFRVVNGSGLKTVFHPVRQGRYLADTKGENPVDVLDEIFGRVREREEKDDLQRTSPSAAEIYTQLDISNAFVVKVQLKLSGYHDRNNRLELGPYLTDERNSGYRLAYESGNGPSISLLRVAPGSSAVIEIWDRGVDVEDGNPHIIEWRRRADGEMVVFLDAKEIIRAMDRAPIDWFDGFSIINKGGDYELTEISIFGAYR
jgi:hypothetical protein